MTSLDLDALMEDARWVLDPGRLNSVLRGLGAGGYAWVGEVAHLASEGAEVPAGAESGVERGEWQMLIAVWLMAGIAVGARAAGEADLVPEPGLVPNPFARGWDEAEAALVDRGAVAVWADLGVDAQAFETRVRVLAGDLEASYSLLAPTYTTIRGEWALIVARWFLVSVLAGALAADPGRQQ